MYLFVLKETVKNALILKINGQLIQRSYHIAHENGSKKQGNCQAPGPVPCPGQGPGQCP